MTITTLHTDADQLASENQIKLIKNLLDEREIDPRSVTMAKIELANGLTKPRAARIIPFLKAQPYQEKPAPTTTKVVDGPGVYVGSSGTIYVAANKPHTKYLNWRRVIIKTGMKPKLVRVYSLSAQTDINTVGGYRMSLDEADSFGKANQYNGLNFCLLCGRQLTAAESVHYGVGPICRGKSVWA